MSIIWEDDFESGNAIGVSYVGDVYLRTASACGVAGTWGAQSYGSEVEVFTGEFAYYLGAGTELEYVRVRLTLDHAGSGYTGEAEGGWDGFTIYDANGFTCGLKHGVGESPGDRSVLYVWSYAENGYNDLGRSAVGTITPGAFQVVELQVWMSTPTTPGGSLPNSDGRMTVTVDGATVVDVTGIKVMSRYTLANGGANRVEGVYFSPMGNADNLGIYDAPAASTWVDVADFVDQEVSASDFPGGVARVACDLWSRDAGVTMQARLWDETNSVSAGESAEVTSQTPTDATFAVALSSGTATYKLQLTADATGTDLFCHGPGLVR